MAAGAFALSKLDRFPEGTAIAAYKARGFERPPKLTLIGSGEKNEVQTLSKTGTVSGGTYTLTFNGHTTSAIAYNADAATIAAALNALADFADDGSDLTVTGGPVNTTAVVITFKGAYLDTDVGAISVNNGSLTGGGSLSVAETTKGVAISASADGNATVSSGVASFTGLAVENHFFIATVNGEQRYVAGIPDPA